MTASTRGWFADVDPEHDPPYQWQPCLETGVGHVPSFPIWFATERECLDWIAHNVVGVGMFDELARDVDDELDAGS